MHCNLLQKNFSIQEWPLYNGLQLEKYNKCFFMFGTILKAINSYFPKGMTFCRNIYVKKVMKLLAFIFEQPRIMNLFTACNKNSSSILFYFFQFCLMIATMPLES